MSLAIKSARVRAQARLGPRGGAGDPGLFSFIGGLAKKAVSFIPGVGPIISTALDVIGGAKGRRPQPQQLQPPTLALPQRSGLQPPPGAPATYREQVLPAGEAGTTLACPSGYHPNKSGYWLKDGGYVPKGAKCVKNRRRNPMNARALSRAITRVDGGKRFQHVLSEIETHKFTKAGNKKEHTH